MNTTKQITAELRDALESAGLLDCDGRDAKKEANRIITCAIEKATEQWEIEYRARLRDSWRVQESRAVHASELDFIDCRESAEFVVKEMFEYGWLHAVSRDQATEWLRDWLSHARTPAHASERPKRKRYSAGGGQAEQRCLRCGVTHRVGSPHECNPAHASERQKPAEGYVIGHRHTNRGHLRDEKPAHPPSPSYGAASASERPTATPKRWSE